MSTRAHTGNTSLSRQYSQIGRVQPNHPSPATNAPDLLNPEDEELRKMVETAAYFNAERRSFHPGLELQDWLAAEVEVMERLISVAKQSRTAGLAT